MASSTSTLTYEIGAVFAAVLLVLGALYALNRYMKRRGGELAAREGRGVLDDRSYNQIRIGQAAAERLARAGTDVTAAQMVLGRAETARKSGSFDTAIELAKKAQDMLALARAEGQPLLPNPGTHPIATTTVARSSWGSPTHALPHAYGPSSLYAAPTTGSPSESSASPTLVTPMDSNRPPKNKMEAHFQLSLATEELERVPSTRPRTKNELDADEFRAQGQAAYDRQDFTEALRLSLRSRRALGTRVDSLPLSAVSRPNAGPTDPSIPSYGSLRDAAAGEASASNPKCPQCGKAATAQDRFCRSCGALIPPVLCTRCGALLQAGDRFCGACGTVQA